MKEDTQPSYDLACHLLKVLEQAGHQARLVGGCVRDQLLGLQPKDYDITTEALPEETMEVLNSVGIKAVPTGIDYGTVTAVSDGNAVEITTLREDVETDGRRAVVKFGKSFEKDAARRDFTINSLSSDLRGKVYDYFSGREHLREKKLIFVGDPETRIREDFLRILRLYRFKARFGFSFEASLEEVLKETGSGLIKVSQERITGELEEIFVALHVTEVVKSLFRSEIFYTIFPFFSKKTSFSKRIIQYCDSVEKLGRKMSLVHFLSACFLFHLEDEASENASSFVNEVGSSLKLSTLKKEQIHSLVCGFFQVKEGFEDQATLLLFAKRSEKKKGSHFFRNVCVPFWLEMAPFFKGDKGASDQVKTALLIYSKNYFRLEAPPLLDTKEVMKLLNLKGGVKLGKVLELRDRAFLNGEVETREAMISFLKEKIGTV